MLDLLVVISPENDVVCARRNDDQRLQCAIPQVAETGGHDVTAGTGKRVVLLAEETARLLPWRISNRRGSKHSSFDFEDTVKEQNPRENLTTPSSLNPVIVETEEG